jgi:methionine--tRNA ligase beta chain
METINFDDFKKLDIRIGKIISAERVEGSDKLLKIEVDFGVEKRQIIAGIGKVYEPESLVGKECPFAFNLESRTLKGLESQGMILCPDNDGKPCLLHPDIEIPPGSIIK